MEINIFRPKRMSRNDRYELMDSPSKQRRRDNLAEKEHKGHGQDDGEPRWHNLVQEQRQRLIRACAATAVRELHDRRCVMRVHNARGKLPKQKPWYWVD